jgi:ribosome modulation factor
MKTTVELPDELMTEVKILAARERRKLGELMAELVQSGIASRSRTETPAQPPVDAEQWLAGWLRLADELMQDASDAGPTARELLDDDRNRLDRR